MMATSNGVARSTRFSLTSAPAASNACTDRMSPLRTANISGVVSPPDRAWMSAPPSISACTTAPLPSAAAHMSADCRFQVSRALIFAPAHTSAFTASTLPARAACIKGVSPAFTKFRGSFGSAPAFISWSMIAALPCSAASASGLTPKLLRAFTLAPARSNSAVVSASFRYAAQCNAVAPSF
jgi:hypothetical protein